MKGFCTEYGCLTLHAPLGGPNDAWMMGLAFYMYVEIERNEKASSRTKRGFPDIY